MNKNKVKNISILIAIAISSIACLNNTTEINTDDTAKVEETVTNTVLPITIWSLGKKTGDFGFSACQTALDNSSGLVEAKLRTLGYTSAIVFGSTPDYNITDLDTNVNALALSDGSRQVVTYTISASVATETSTFGSTSASLTIADAIKIQNTADGTWQTTASELLGTLGINTTDAEAEFWSFSENNGNYSTFNCAGAINATSAIGGYVANTTTTLYSADSCDQLNHVLCVAK